jgi:hypothetical protein
VVQTRLGHREPSDSFAQRVNRALDAVDRDHREAVRQRSLRPPHRAATWRWAPVAAACLLVMLIGSAAWLVARPDLIVGKVDLATAHRAHQEQNLPLNPVPGHSPEEASAVLAKSLGYPVSVSYPSSAVPVRYVGAGICRCFDKKGCALFLYRDEQNRPISLFHFHGGKPRFIGLNETTLDGRPVWRGRDGKLNLLVWPEGSTYQAWVSEAPLEQISPFSCSGCGY